MPAPARSARGFLALIMLLALSLAAGAAETTPPAAPAAPPAPAAAPAAQSAPSAGAVAAADQLLIAMGVKDTIAETVATMMTEFEHNVTTTRPEIRDSLRATLIAIKPEFDKSAQLTYEKVEALLALALSEKELEEVAAFFASPTGKKYLAMEPSFFQHLQGVVGPWRDELSTDIVARARQEMRKKGVEF
jgi:hypothetical protein